MAHPPSPEQRIDAPVLTALSGTTPGRIELRLRMTLRHSLPVVGVVVVVMLVAVIAYYVYASNRHGAVALSNDLITAIDRRVAAQTQAYLAPAEQFLELADAAAAGRGVFEGSPEVETFALHALGKIAARRGLQLRRSRGQLPVRAAQCAGRLRHQDDRPPQRRTSRDLGPPRRRRAR